MLEMKNKNKNAYYKIGDEISFQVTGDKSKVTGEIIELRDSIIVFKDYQININKISSIYIDDKTKWWLRYKVEQLFLLAGAGYLLADIINSGEVNSETLLISGAMISVGVIAKLLIGNKIKMKGRTRLRILKL